MLPELGHFALILALLLAALQAFFGIGGAMLGRERWIAAVTPAVAGAGARGARRDQPRLSALYARHLQSLPSARSGRPGRPRPESDPPGPGAGGAPPHPLYGLCRLCGRVRVRLRGDARRAARPDLGPLDAALDHGRLGLSHLRHCAGELLGVLAGMGGGALSLYAWRAPVLKSTAGFGLGGRESFLLFNTVLLVIAAATVFAGTLAPLISDALKLGTVSVGPPYFNPVFMLSMLPLLTLLSVGIHSNWKRGRLKDKQRTLLYTLVAAAVLACGVVFGIYSHGRMLTPVGATLALWIVLASLVDPIDRWRRGLSLSRAVVGMTVAHLGLALAALALTTVQSFTIEKDVALAPGASTSAG